MRARTAWLVVGALVVVLGIGAVARLFPLAGGPNRAAPAPRQADVTTPAPRDGHSQANVTTPAPREGHSQPGDIDTMHMHAMRAFPAKTEGEGGALLPFRLENGYKVFELTTKVVQWEVTPGVKKEAWTYNGMIPGPQIRISAGDRVRVILHNQLPQSTTIHWHGMIVPDNMDGVSYLNQLPVKPGGSFTYEFTANDAGTYMYHSHHDGTKQVGRGLLGPLIVEPKDPATYPVKWDREYTMVLNDGWLGYGINGKGFPATKPLVARKGETVLLRYMNEGAMIHPMHLHGQEQWVVARDGFALPQPYRVDTISVAPGERWDLLVKAGNSGRWVLHCHIFPHAEGDMGMYGLATEFWVTDSPTSDHVADPMATSQ